MGTQIALPGGQQHGIRRVVRVLLDLCIRIIDNAGANVTHFWIITHHSGFGGAKCHNHYRNIK